MSFSLAATFSSIVLVLASVSFWTASCASLDCFVDGRKERAALRSKQNAAAEQGRKGGGERKKTKAVVAALFEVRMYTYVGGNGGGGT